MKTLYFEGAGISDADIGKATIGNCRIRTAFRLDADKKHPQCSCSSDHSGNEGKGPLIYMEISCGERTKRSPSEIYHWQYTGFVLACFYITDDMPNDDENMHQIHLPESRRVFEYTEEAILHLVNSLGASFDAVKVVPDLGGYRVFKTTRSPKGTERYYYGDEFHFDPDLIARRKAVYDRVYEIEAEEIMRANVTRGKEVAGAPGGTTPNFSMWVDENDPGLLHLLRHFIGGNKHWTIRTDKGDKLDDWMATAQETRLGRYGC